MARPSPVPPNSRVSFCCAKASKTSSCFSFGMPMPVSRTSKRRETPSASRSPVTLSTISPTSVNFTALPRRLMSTWRSRPGSPVTRTGSSGATLQMSSTSCAWARAASVATAFSHMSRRSKGSADQLQMAGLDLRQVEHVVHNHLQRAGRVADHVHVFALRLIERCLAQKLRHSHDPAHGRPDFVAHMGHELGLRLRRAERLVAGPLGICAVARGGRRGHVRLSLGAHQRGVGHSQAAEGRTDRPVRRKEDDDDLDEQKRDRRKIAQNGHGTRGLRRFVRPRLEELARRVEPLRQFFHAVAAQRVPGVIRLPLLAADDQSDQRDELSRQHVQALALGMAEIERLQLGRECVAHRRVVCAGQVVVNLFELHQGSDETRIERLDPIILPRPQHFAREKQHTLAQHALLSALLDRGRVVLLDREHLECRDMRNRYHRQDQTDRQRVAAKQLPRKLGGPFVECHAELALDLPAKALAPKGESFVRPTGNPSRALLSQDVAAGAG